MADQYDHDLEEAIRLSLLELEKASPKPTVLTASIPAVPPRPPPPVHAEDAIDPEILLAIELSLAEAAEQRPQTFEKAENVPVEKTRTPGSETVSIPPEKLRKIKKLKYYYQGNLGVDLLLEENNSLKIQARDQLSANIAKAHLEERISNWSLVEKESATLKSQHIHIYIDQSHLFHGCQFVSNGSAQGTVRRDATVGVSCSKLHKFLKKGRNVQEKHVFGSIHPKIGGFVHPKWKAMDYHPILTDQSYQATSSSSRFAAKDSNAIVSQLQKTIMFSKALPPSHSRTLLIVVGGREQEGSPWDLQLDALLEVVHQAIFNRWCVELWMWKDTAERAILDMRDFYPPDVFSILFLDNHRDHIVTRVKRRPVIPPPPLPPPPPPRPVSTTTTPGPAPTGPVRRSSSKTSKLLDIARWFSSSSKETGFVALDDEDTVAPVITPRPQPVLAPNFESYFEEEEEGPGEPEENTDDEDEEEGSKGEGTEGMKKAGSGAEQMRDKNKEDELRFTCPITFDVFRDPVRTKYGHYFERSFLVEWVKKSNACPLTQQPLSLADVRNAERQFLLDLQDYRKRNNL